MTKVEQVDRDAAAKIHAAIEAQVRDQGAIDLAVTDITLDLENGLLVTTLARHRTEAIERERERCALVCEQQAKEFLSEQYATPQPIGSIIERFACTVCATAIRGSEG
jgi:hypothetical protein